MDLTKDNFESVLRQTHANAYKAGVNGTNADHRELIMVWFKGNCGENARALCDALLAALELEPVKVTYAATISLPDRDTMQISGIEADDTDAAHDKVRDALTVEAEVRIVATFTYDSGGGNGTVDSGSDEVECDIDGYNGDELRQIQHTIEDDDSLAEIEVSEDGEWK